MRLLNGNLIPVEDADKVFQPLSSTEFVYRIDLHSHFLNDAHFQ